MNFKLEMKNSDDHKVLVEFNCVTLEEFFEYCKDFLNGCSFIVSDIEFNNKSVGGDCGDEEE